MASEYRVAHVTGQVALMDHRKFRAENLADDKTLDFYSFAEMNDLEVGTRQIG